ncbi:MAG: M81 family metallopeptidase [Clostridiaceae bacterium]|jgi:microcystin degradation protein MlrC|nr:M81 family metallopeptidase [Clostridiaceae bacterium]
MKYVLIAEFKQETNTFIGGNTGLDDFKARNLLHGDEVLAYFKNSKNEIGAFIDTLSPRRDVHILPSVAANAIPGPIVAREVFEYVYEHLMYDIKNAQALDGILLSFHGAMVVEGIEDPEGILLEEIRTIVGDKLPICVSMDFHANITDKMASNSTLMFPFRRYPHTDMYESGLNAANSLLALLDGKLTPVMRFRKLPILCPLLTSDEQPFKSFLDAATAFEQEERIISASISAGFPYADIYESGMSILVQTNGDDVLADCTISSLFKTVWEKRNDLVLNIDTPRDAVAKALMETGIVVLADVTDNPGAGSPGDATELIHELLRQNAQNTIVATIYDPETVHQALKAGPGKTIHVSLGGKSDPRVGAPIIADAYVKSISDGIFSNKGAMSHGVVNRLGATAVLVIGGISIIVASERYQPWDPEIFRSNGIEPTEASIIVLKSSIHYRAAFGQFAARMIPVNAPNIWTLDLKLLGIHNSRRPVLPLDKVETNP